MTTKWIEIRDRGTLVPALAMHLSERDGYLAQRAGYGEQGCILLINLGRLECQHDPFEWNLAAGRTLHIAHVWLSEHWDEQQDGGVLDVEFILGERATPKTSEAVTA